MLVALHYFMVPMVPLGTNRPTQFTVVTPEVQPRDTVVTLRNQWNQQAIASLSYLVVPPRDTPKIKGSVLILYRYPSVNTVSRSGHIDNLVSPKYLVVLPQMSWCDNSYMVAPRRYNNSW